MPITRSQFKLRKRSPPLEPAPSPRKSRRRGGEIREEPDDAFQNELEMIYIGEKSRKNPNLRKKVGYDDPVPEKESGSEEEWEEGGSDEDNETGEESEGDQEEGEEESESDQEEKEEEVEEEEEDEKGTGEEEASGSEAEDEDEGTDTVQDLNAAFFKQLDAAILCLQESLTNKDSLDQEKLAQNVTELDAQFCSLLSAGQILSPHEEEKSDDEEKLKLLEKYKELVEVIPDLVNDEGIDLIIRQRAAIAVNNFAKSERGSRALKAAVRAYLSDTRRQCALIEDLGSALREDGRKRIPVAAREAREVVQNFSAEDGRPSSIFVTNLMTLLNSLTPDDVGSSAVKHKPGSFEAIADELWTELICGVASSCGFEKEPGVKTREPLELDDFNARRLLIRLPSRIFPLMKNPRIATDLLQRYFQRGGIFTFLSLEGIFTLMTKYHLDFPKFYARLYASLNASFFTSKYRNVYFKLMDRFLSSTHLPDYLLRAFVKKLARLALGAPTDAAFGLIPFIFNLVIRYPSLRSLVTADFPTDGANDPFDVNEPNPEKSNARNSCLWELKSLTLHCCPDVAEMAVRVLKQPMPTIESNIAKRIDTNMDYVFRSVTNRVVPPDVALAIRPDLDFLKLSYS